MSRYKIGDSVRRGARVSANRGIRRARALGAVAGEPEALALWDLTKRELIEVAISLAAHDDARHDVRLAVAWVFRERAYLKDRGFI